jgi:hypothetical protein
MSDYFFSDFYKRVRDDSWPDATTYNDFLKLPYNIQQECFQMHNFQQRLNQLEDEKYWKDRSFHNTGYQCQNIVYVPVMKCANSYYVDLLHVQNGWTPVNLSDLDLDNIHLFGLLLHPFTRRVKGILENLCQSYDYDYKKLFLLLQQADFAKFLGKIIILDAHTMPYSFIFGHLLEKINWIPMEPYTDIELQQQIKQFADAHTVNIKLPNTINRINQSSPMKQQCFIELQKIYSQTRPPAELYQMFSRDLSLYHRLIESHENNHNYNTRRS